MKIRLVVLFCIITIIALSVPSMPVSAALNGWTMVASWPGGWTVSKNQTKFFDLIGDIDSTTTEKNAQTLIRDSYTLSHLRIFLTSSTRDTATTFAVRVNGVNTSVSVTIPSGTISSTWYEDTTHSINLVDGDLVCLYETNASTTGNMYIGLVLCDMTGSSYIQQACMILGDTWNIASPCYLNIGGYLGSTTIEENAKYLARQSVTYSNLRVVVAVNTSSSAVTVRTRINGINGNQVVTIPAGSTTTQEDITHTDSVLAGQTVDYIVEGGDASTVGFAIVQMKAISDGFQLMTSDPAGIASVITADKYFGLSGPTNGGTTNESRSDSDLHLEATVKNMYVNVIANTRDTDTIVMLRKNLADTTLTVTIPAGVTGVIEDIANVVSIVNGDTLNFKIAPTIGTGSLTLAVIGVEVNTATASVVAPTITISATTSITSTTATLNGNVTTNGGEDPVVTSCWGSTDGGTDSESWDNSSIAAYAGGVAAFTKDITGLTSGTKYYNSANGTNSGGTDWPAASGSFLTLPVNPTILSSTADNTKVTFTWTNATVGAGSTASTRIIYQIDNPIVSPTYSSGTVGVDWTTGTGPVDIESLTNDHLYYFYAFTKVVNGALTQYSTSYASTSATPTGGGGGITPTITSTTIIGIHSIYATGGANITSDGGSPITARGICLDTNIDPDITKAVFITTGTTGIFTISLTSLTESTDYHIRGYVTNANGTVYSNDLAFTTNASGTIYSINGIPLR